MKAHRAWSEVGITSKCDAPTLPPLSPGRYAFLAYLLFFLYCMQVGSARLFRTASAQHSRVQSKIWRQHGTFIQLLDSISFYLYRALCCNSVFTSVMLPSSISEYILDREFGSPWPPTIHLLLSPVVHYARMHIFATENGPENPQSDKTWTQFLTGLADLSVEITPTNIMPEQIMIYMCMLCRKQITNMELVLITSIYVFCCQA